MVLIETFRLNNVTSVTMNRILPGLLLVASLAIGNQTFSQVRLGVKVGVNTSNIHFDLIDTDPIPGYQAGLMADLDLTSHFSIQPALLVNSKGYSSQVDFRDNNGQIQETVTETYRLIYAEIPFLLVYKGDLGKSWRWYGGIGPYVGIGITGKIKRDSDILEDQKIEFTSNEVSPYRANVYRRMDYGLNAALGVEKGKLQFGINYSHGLSGMIPVDGIPNSVKLYNRTLALTAGYWFGK